jgi:hypothetical protein
MGPDIQWRVGESAGQETIVKATPPRRSRRGWIAILIVVLLGVGLGIAYRAIPEPAPRPTPLPSPTPRSTSTYPAIPAKLYATIDREAQALADGDVQAYLALHVYEDPFWTQQFTSTFRAWQRPANDQPLYSIVDFNQRTATLASVDIRQFRNGRSFRETRFYVWEKDRWLRREVDPFFWSGRTEIIDTPHFHVIYFVEDRDFIQPVIDQLEQARDKLCVDLGCDATPLTYTLRFTSYSTREWSISGNGREIRFASPRVIGVYEDGNPLGDERLNLIWTLAWTTGVQRAYGQLSVTEDRAGNLLLWAVSRWATMRAIERPDIESLPKLKASLIKWPLPLEMLWNGPTERYDPAIYDLAYATIYFIEQEYGAQSMPRLLSALGNAQSLADAVENGLGVPFAEFEQKWQAWVKSDSPVR